MKKFLFDLFPLFLFFLAYRFTDIFVATGVAMAAAVLQIVWLKATGRATEAMHWINLTVILVFGGATIWLHSDVFIKWKTRRCCTGCSAAPWCSPACCSAAT